VIWSQGEGNGKFAKQQMSKFGKACCRRCRRWTQIKAGSGDLVDGASALVFGLSFGLVGVAASEDEDDDRDEEEDEEVGAAEEVGEEGEEHGWACNCGVPSPPSGTLQYGRVGDPGSRPGASNHRPLRGLRRWEYGNISLALGGFQPETRDRTRCFFGGPGMPITLE
jgi:hypothetical protein